MEIALLLLIILTILVAFLALFDGMYLHLFKYRLQNQPDSRLEHLTHCMRAILFPLILYFLFLQHMYASFFLIGISLVSIDLFVLIIDAYSEKESRAFMGGLPRWEYILHLFVNGFHLSLIFVFLAIKLKISQDGIYLSNELMTSNYYQTFIHLVEFVLPGSVIFALFHVLTTAQGSNQLVNKYVLRLPNV